MPATQPPVAGFTRALVLVFIALPVVLVVGALGAVVYLSSRAPQGAIEQPVRVTPALP